MTNTCECAHQSLKMLIPWRQNNKHHCCSSVKSSSKASDREGLFRLCGWMFLVATMMGEAPSVWFSTSSSSKALSTASSLSRWALRGFTSQRGLFNADVKALAVETKKAKKKKKFIWCGGWGRQRCETVYQIRRNVQQLYHCGLLDPKEDVDTIWQNRWGASCFFLPWSPI